MIIVDVVIEFLSWLFDRENYKKNTVKSLKITGAIIGVALLAAIALLLILFIVYLRR